MQEEAAANGAMNEASGYKGRLAFGQAFEMHASGARSMRKPSLALLRRTFSRSTNILKNKPIVDIIIPSDA
jgi:hypothetical protein